MTALGVHSEVGKLRQVIVHRPDLSLKRLTPGNHDELLFDDVLWVERAQWEHDQFVARMRERGVEVFYVQDLLSEALGASQDARQRLTDLVTSEYVVGTGLVEPVRTDSNIRLYSDEDLQRVRVIRYLTQQRGVNLAGVKMLLQFRDAADLLRELASAIDELDADGSSAPTPAKSKRMEM